MNHGRVELGQVILICGPMFAGKTTGLITWMEEARSEGLRALVVKPITDTRYAVDRVVTHDGVGIDAVGLATAEELGDCVGDAKVVGVDEVHFFDASFADGCKQLADQGVHVICAGVDLDHRGNVFDSIAAIESIADEVIRVTAKCARCGAVAKFTQRMVERDARIVVGGAGDYEPRCVKCFERTKT